MRDAGVWAVFYSAVAPPSNVRGSAGFNYIDWSWDAVPGVRGYAVSTSPGGFRTVIGTSFRQRNLYLNQTYRISVRSILGGVRSGATSASATLRLYSAIPNTPSFSLTGEYNNAPFIIVRINSVPNASIYDTEWKQTTETRWRISRQSVRQFVLGPLTRGATYQVRVRARNHLGASALSAIQTITPPQSD